jgi:chemotaxis protein CheD
MAIAEIMRASMIMTNEPIEFREFPTYVKLGEIIASDTPEKYNLLGLGTCLGIFMYDLKKKHYLMAHCLLPEYNEHTERDNNLAGKFTDTAIRKMVKRMLDSGSVKSDIKVKMAGGSQIYNDMLRVGERNIQTAHRVLKEENIPLVAEDVGGNTGRSILSFNQDGTIDIRRDGKKYQI